MTAITVAPVLTTEQLLEFPDDGVLRELYQGQLREWSMSRRGRLHTGVLVAISEQLRFWWRKQPTPRGQVLGGDAAFRLQHDPDTTVGVDIAYLSAELAAGTPRDVFIIDGAPVLAVEILSPSDTQQNITDKIAAFLQGGVRLVWIVEPLFRTVTVYRPDVQPQLFNVEQELTAEPHLPGFRVPVAEFFTLA